MTEEQLRKIIIDIILRISKVEVKDYSENLLGKRYNVTPREMIYIVDYLEKELGYNIGSIFETEDINIMTVDSLTREILKISNRIKMD